MLAGCRIERTPEQYIDNQAARAEALLVARDELAVRIASLGPALQRGTAAVDSILAPGERITIIGPGPRQVIEDPRELAGLLIALPAGEPVTAGRVEVTVAPGIVFAWFTAEFVADPSNPPDTGFRVSGVFLRENAAWRLTQAHVSRPVTDPMLP